MSEEGRGDLYRLAALLSELARILDALPQESAGDFQLEMVPPPPLPPTGVPGLGVGQPGGRAPARSAAEWANLVPARPPAARIPPPLPPWIEPPAAPRPPANAPSAHPPAAPADEPRGESEPGPVSLSPEEAQAGVTPSPPAVRVPEGGQIRRTPSPEQVDIAPPTRLAAPAAPNPASPMTASPPKQEPRQLPLPPSGAPEVAVPASRIAAAVSGSGRAALPIPATPKQAPLLAPIANGLPQPLLAPQRRQPPPTMTPMVYPVPLPVRPVPGRLASPALLRRQPDLPAGDRSARTPPVPRAPDAGPTGPLPTDAAPISIVVPWLELPNDVAQLDPPVEEFDLEAAGTVPPLARAPLDARPVMWRGRSVGVVAADLRHALRARLERRFVSRLALRLP